MSAKFSFVFSAGALSRNSARFQIESYCARRDLECKVIENKGFLSSEFQVIIRGNDESVIQARTDLASWFDKINDAN